jgi:hypothetical protein
VGSSQPSPTMLASHISLWPFHKHLPSLDSMPSPLSLPLYLPFPPPQSSTGTTGCSSFRSGVADSCQAIRSLGVHHPVNVTVESVCRRRMRVLALLALHCIALQCSAVRCVRETSFARIPLSLNPQTYLACRVSLCESLGI